MDYVEAFKNLRTNNKYGRKSPHKAILMLTVIELYEQNILTENEIFYNETLKSIFLKVWNRVLPEEPLFHPDAYLPFWYLQNDSFWHIVPIRGKEDILSLMRDSNIKPSESKLNDSVRCAELDEDLYFLMTIASGRSSLKRALLETYTSLSDEQIDKLSGSTDNSIDHSLSALNEYEQILSSSKNDEVALDKGSSNEMVQQFRKLNDDLQITLNYEYFSFLKSHRSERDLLRETCPDVYALYDRLVNNPLRQIDISPSFAFAYENFLCDLKIALMSENGSMDLIDKIETAIAILRGNAIERDDVDIHYKSQEESNIEQHFEEDSKQAPLLLSKDEQLPSNKSYTIENQNNHCYIIDNFGEKVFSSSGKLIIIDEDIYRVCHTNTNINMHLVRKDERGMYALGKRVLSLRVYSPLYSVLDDMDNINQIKAVRFDSVNEEYHVLVGDRWYGSSGYYADFDQNKIQDPINNATVESYATSSNELNSIINEDKSIETTGNVEDSTFENTYPLINDSEIEHVYLDHKGKIVNIVTPVSKDNAQKDEPSESSRKGKAWTQEEEERITHYFERGISTADIAERIGRTEIAIKARLAKLGLIEYTYGQDEADAESLYFMPVNLDDFQIENGFTKTNIFNKHGEKVFTDDGKLKIIHGKLYRLKLKNQCFTIKDMQFNGKVWMKGGKKIVAYPQTVLYKIMDGTNDYSDAVEDIFDGATFHKCKVKVNGCWYDNQGDLITDSSIHDDATEESPKQYNDYLKTIKDPLYAVRKQALLRAMGFFRLPVKIRDIVRTISRTAWGAPINENDVEEMITTIPEIESIDGSYYLRESNNNKKKTTTGRNKEVSIIPKRKSSVSVGNWILWKPTGIIGKVVGFKNAGPQQKLVLRTKVGVEIEVYDYPRVYEIVM